VAASARNLGVPSRACAPPLDGALLWAMLGHIASLDAPLRDVGALRALLGLHNFRAASGEARDAEVHARRMAALRGVEAHAADRLVPLRALAGPGRPAPPAARATCRGTEVQLVVDGPQLDGEGIAWLYGAVLDRVLAGWSTLNTFTRLVVREAGGLHEELRWAPRTGDRTLA
jgi:type VI secretion system protein ImpG